MASILPLNATAVSLGLDETTSGIFHDTVNDNFCISPISLRERVVSLPLLHKTMTKDAFGKMFPKACPDCIALNLFCAAEYLHDTKLGHETLKQLLNDPEGHMVTHDQFAEVCKHTRSVYKRSTDQYPYQGNCNDFDCAENMNKKPNFLIYLKLVGSLLQDSKFSHAMSKDKTACTEYLHANFKHYLGGNTENLEAKFGTLDEFCYKVRTRGGNHESFWSVCFGRV